MISKTKLRDHLYKLPETFTIDELVESLVFISKVESGLEDSNNGRKISEQELDNKMKQWFE